MSISEPDICVVYKVLTTLRRSPVARPPYRCEYPVQEWFSTNDGSPLMVFESLWLARRYVSRIPLDVRIWRACATGASGPYGPADMELEDWHLLHRYKGQYARGWPLGTIFCQHVKIDRIILPDEDEYGERQIRKGTYEGGLLCRPRVGRPTHRTPLCTTLAPAL